MATAMTNEGEAKLERAFSQLFSPDAYELINAYKLYDEALQLEVALEGNPVHSDPVSNLDAVC